MGNHVLSPSTPEQPSITVIVHPPERRRQQVAIPAQAGGCCCCCCCCCCLHSVGGLAGGLVGSFLPVEPTPIENDSPFPFRRDEPEPDKMMLPTLVYWLVFLLLTGLTGLAFAAQIGPTGGGGGGGVIWAGILTLLVLPGVQLVASLLAVIVVAIFPSEFIPDKGAALRRIGKITLWSFVGGLIGLLPMVVVVVVLLALK